MSDEAKKKEDAGARHADKPGDKKEAGKAASGGLGAMLTKTPVLLGAAMIIEAVVLFAGVKFLGGGSAKDAALAAELTTEEETSSHGDAPAPAAQGGDASHSASASHGSAPAAGSASKVDRKRPAEVQVVDFRAPNKQSGRTFLYDVTIFAVTRGEYKERVETTIKEREALIKDRVRTIIAQSDPEKLGGGSEPGLETLRRQVKYQLDEIVGPDLIEEVLVPRCIPFRTDY